MSINIQHSSLWLLSQPFIAVILILTQNEKANFTFKKIDIVVKTILKMCQSSVFLALHCMYFLARKPRYLLGEECVCWLHGTLQLFAFRMTIVALREDVTHHQSFFPFHGPKKAAQGRMPQPVGLEVCPGVLFLSNSVVCTVHTHTFTYLLGPTQWLHKNMLRLFIGKERNSMAVRTFKKEKEYVIVLILHTCWKLKPAQALRKLMLKFLLLSAVYFIIFMSHMLHWKQAMHPPTYMKTYS